MGPHPVVSPGTREASFVHAISSAGVAHAVTRSCSSGELENCGCDRSLRGMSPEGFQVRVYTALSPGQTDECSKSIIADSKKSLRWRYVIALCTSLIVYLFSVVWLLRQC